MTDLNKLKQYIVQFHPISDDAYRMMSDCMQYTELKKKEILIKAGRIDSNFYIPFHGYFRAYHLDNTQNEITVYFVTPGNPVASMASYFHSEPAKLQIEAITDASVFIIPKDDMERLCSQSIEIANWFRMVCLDELYCLEHRCIVFGESEAGFRYKSMIKSRPEIMKHVPLKYIASYLGITQQSLSRLRLQLKNDSD